MRAFAAGAHKLGKGVSIMKSVFFTYALAAAISMLAAIANVSQAFADQPAASRTFEFTYSATVPETALGAGGAYLWIPLPPDTERQKVHAYEVESDYPYEIVQASDIYANRFFKFDVSGASGPAQVSITFTVTRTAYSIDPFSPVSTASVIPLDPLHRERYLSPDKLVPIDGVIAEEAFSVAGELNGEVAVARALYENIVDTVEYDKSGEGWGRGDAIYACDVRAGNCTDFHSLFIGEARSLGIPSRFIIGFPLPDEHGEGEIGGYHCWGEFYTQSHGWLPVDASEARKFPEKREMFFCGLCENRIEFTMGRDIEVPGTAGLHNFFIYPYAEADGQPVSGVEKKFAFRDLG